MLKMTRKLVSDPGFDETAKKLTPEKIEKTIDKIKIRKAGPISLDRRWKFFESII